MGVRKRGRRETASNPAAGPVSEHVASDTMVEPDDPRGTGQPGRVHVSVLAEQVLSLFEAELGPDFDGWFVDATAGAGGHAAALLERFPRAHLLATDQDPEILEIARRRLAPYGERVELDRCRFSGLSRKLRKLRHGLARGWLMDLGASSLQLDRPERGFSFQSDGPLDMRMDPSRERTAADIVNRWDETDLADLFFYEGGERHSRQLARAIVEARRRAPFLRTGGLADLVERVLGPSGRLHAATRVFQALRRAVNEEGEEQLAGLEAAENGLADGGVLAVISFHSGEDGVVKRFFQTGGQKGRWRILTKKPIRPDHAEERSNPRARSARLRAGVRAREADLVREATLDATARTLAERPPLGDGSGDEREGRA